MKRIIGYSVLTAALLALLWNPVLAPTYTYAVRELANTFSALQTFSAGLTVSAGTAKLQVNSISLNRQTGITQPGTSSTLDISSGFNHVQPTSVTVQSGCLTYDFAFYPDDTYTIGEELLMYQGQSLDLFSSAIPALRDDDLTGEVHAKFWNRGNMGCTFRLLMTGGGF